MASGPGRPPFSKASLAGWFAEQLLDALLDADTPEAERVMRDAIESGLPQPLIADAVVAPAMRRIGELWATGEISVDDEHLATQISFRLLALMRESFRVAA